MVHAARSRKSQGGVLVLIACILTTRERTGAAVGTSLAYLRLEQRHRRRRYGMVSLAGTVHNYCGPMESMKPNQLRARPTPSNARTDAIASGFPTHEAGEQTSDTVISCTNAAAGEAADDCPKFVSGGQ